jgi:hypothetical protein
LLRSHALFEATNDVEILDVLGNTAVPVNWWQQLFHRKRDPQIGRGADGGAEELSRRNTNDRIRDIIDSDRFADCGRIGGESSLPPRVTHDRYRMAAGSLIVSFSQHAAESCVDSEHREITPGD